MKRCDRRILTSHVGSLPRADALVELKQAKFAGETCTASVFVPPSLHRIRSTH